MARETRARGQAEKVIVALEITSGSQDDCPESAGADSVGRGRIVEELYVCAEFEPKMVEIGSRDTGNECGGAEGVRDAVDGREHIQTPDGVGDHVSDEELRKASVWHTVRAGADAFFNCAYGTFNFAHVAISRDNVEMDWMKIISDAGEFVIGVDVGDCKTPRGV